MTAATGQYRIRFAADPVQLIFFRAGLNAWLRGLRWPEPERIDAVLAVSEACTNAVEHAYRSAEPGDVEVIGRLVVDGSARRIVVVVRDEGRWRTRASERGYGLRTVHECMEKVRIRHGVDGTAVTMISRPVPVLEVDGGRSPDAAPPGPPRSAGALERSPAPRGPDRTSGEIAGHEPRDRSRRSPPGGRS
ncbi:ATP-binding protein [Pseudonocardia adelaidensis]|uniref:Histidine kinase/HSP90-like ATPase domain-containing protein n=1 Tax=Pseudonocardia adelaidensis TaxID=648754 RepID=A0ABP9NZW9_9PSEU